MRPNQSLEPTRVGKSPLAAQLQRWTACLLLALVAACSTTEDQVNSGLWHYEAGLHAQASQRLVGGAEALQRSNPADPRLPRVFMALGRMAEGDHRAELAERYYRRAVQAVDEFHASDDVLVRNAAVDLGAFYLAMRRYPEAIPWLTRATQISAKSARSSNRYAIDLDNLSQALAGAGRFAEAMTLSEQALQALSALPPSAENIATRGIVFFNRAYALAEQGKPAQAQADYRRAMADMASCTEAWRVKLVRQSYAAFLRQQGQNAEADALESAGP